ncbi:hypothetical protein [Faecalibacterium hattorii]|uniref:hypothetical protein n=1 Tax=Faecalibacterium hattorii TaxID=2935520 RepID=UPI003AAD2B5F
MRCLISACRCAAPPRALRQAAGGWMHEGTLRVRWRLGVRLDRCLKASQLAALTIERPLLYRLAGASRVVLYPAGQKRTLTLLSYPCEQRAVLSLTA